MKPLKKIAEMRSAFPEKFGIPRQSGLVEELRSTVVFEPEYRDPAALRGLEDFSHIWLIWGFSKAERDTWASTVRPPRLGGNARMGVFATRSPFRPNGLGLSAVRLAGLRQDPALGPVLHVLGADLMDGTPIYDIKPYLPYADCIPGAAGGFAGAAPRPPLRVQVPGGWPALVPPEERAALEKLLALDPRPSYQDDADRVYGLAYAGLEVKFTVAAGVLTVRGVAPARP